MVFFDSIYQVYILFNGRNSLSRAQQILTRRNRHANFKVFFFLSSIKKKKKKGNAKVRKNKIYRSMRLGISLTSASPAKMPKVGKAVLEKCIQNISESGGSQLTINSSEKRVLVFHALLLQK